MKTTLLITTFNRANLLYNSLMRLTNLTIPDEVLVVDDGSTDNTEQVCEDFKAHLPIKYIYNHNPNWSICSMARNIGVKNALGDIIITSEPELLFVTDIVKQMVDERPKFKDQIISVGVIYHAQSETPFNPGLITDAKSALKSEIVENYQIQPRSYHQSGYVKTLNMQAMFACLYEKKWLMDLGGWDESFPGCWGWDDVDLATRLRVSGINQHICPDMEALHQFHAHPPQDDWMKGAHDNELHFKRKDLQDKNNPNLVANQGVEWGVIKSR